MQCLCLYYSATGNTERAVELLRRRFVGTGSRLETVKIRKGMAAPAMDAYEGLIVAFPVLAFSPPVFVRRFIRSLPKAGGRGAKRMRAYVLAVDGGGGGSAAARAVRLLERRGYDVAASGRASYPDNWTQFVEPAAPAERTQRTEAGDAMAESFADAVLSAEPGSRSVDRRLSVADLIGAFGFGTIGRRAFGRTYYADEDCNACGLCRKHCPAGTILLGEGPRARPFWKTGCEACNACINLCPQKAIITSVGRIVTLSALIVVCCIPGIWAYFALARPTLASVSAAPTVLFDLLAVCVLLILGHALPVWPLDGLLLRWVQHRPAFRRFFAWTFMKDWRRYRAARPDEAPQ
jgi:ferredoxin